MRSFHCHQATKRERGRTGGLGCLPIVFELTRSYSSRVNRKEGRWVDSDLHDEEMVLNEPGLAQCYAGAITGVLALGPKSGTRVMRLFGQASTPNGAKTQTPGHGFNVHAWTRISANDRNGLERICRYLIRPPLSKERVRLMHDGRIKLRLKRPWSDGTTHMVYDPVDFLTLTREEYERVSSA